MSEAIRMALWWNPPTQPRIVPALAMAAAALPLEARERGVLGLTVTALDWSEAPLRTERFEVGAELEAALERAAEGLAEDCACTLEMAWLLWNFEGGEWQQRPCRIELTGFGAGFGDSERRRTEGDLLVDFGLDEVFLAELAPWNQGTRQHLQANIVQLLKFARQLELSAQPDRRKLWGETEGDWTAKLVRRLAEAEEG